MVPLVHRRGRGVYSSNAARKAPALLACLLTLLPTSATLSGRSGACRAAETPAPARVTAAQIDETVKKAVNYLWSQQTPEGQWETDTRRDGIDHYWERRQGDTWGGYTALSVYALLAAGEKRNDPRMAKAINFLKTADIVGIYALAMRCQVWLSLGNTVETRGLLTADLRKLEAGIYRTGPAAGMWDYGTGHGTRGAPSRTDHSISQYGVLALWAGRQMDVPVSGDLWKLIDGAWRAQQDADGGWAYSTNAEEANVSTPSMTAAGIATLFITQDVLRSGSAAVAAGNFADKKIDDGLTWMAANFDKVVGNYTWYGVERIGAASGYKYFGKEDWYAVGTEKIVQGQQADGTWPSLVAHAGPVTEAAFALLFLCHGRSPLMMNKLDYAVGADGHFGDAPWNERNRDAANLTRFTAHNMEVLLNWQIVNLASPVEDWHDAPLLFLAGSKALNFTPREEAKIQAYIRQGGMIVANSDAPPTLSKASKNSTRPADAFGESLQALGKRLFGFEFRPLPPTHPILAGESYKSTRWHDDPAVLGLSNGVRELMVLLPNDTARAWQVDARDTETDKFELGTDVFLYAVDKQDLRNKGQTYLVKPEAPVRRTVAVARLLVGANPDPEPGGWPRISAVTTNANGTALDVRFVRLGDGSLLRPVAPLPTTAPAGGASPAATRPATTAPSRASRFKIAHLTGTTAFKLNAAQRKELSDFTAGGGTLIVDAAGGSSAFADSAETELAAVFGGNPRDLGAVLPPTHPVYKMPGSPITSFGWRGFARAHVGNLNGPRVRAVEEGDRATLFYSREDLSAGMVGESVDGIIGYGPVTATAIMRNLILYSAK